MASSNSIRQTISLPGPTAQRVRALARNRHISANRVLVELVEAGLESKEQEKKRFFELADQLARTKSPDERKKIKETLARMTFGEQSLAST
jgi:predicted DNA-binding protein